jgi:hypothetical protein
MYIHTFIHSFIRFACLPACLPACRSDLRGYIIRATKNLSRAALLDASTVESSRSNRIESKSERQRQLGDMLEMR